MNFALIEVFCDDYSIKGGQLIKMCESKEDAKREENKILSECQKGNLIRFNYIKQYIKDFLEKNPPPSVLKHKEWMEYRDRIFGKDNFDYASPTNLDFQLMLKLGPIQGQIEGFSDYNPPPPFKTPTMIVVDMKGNP